MRCLSLPLLLYLYSSFFLNEILEELGTREIRSQVGTRATRAASCDQTQLAQQCVPRKAYRATKMHLIYYHFRKKISVLPAFHLHRVVLPCFFYRRSPADTLCSRPCLYNYTVSQFKPLHYVISPTKWKRTLKQFTQLRLNSINFPRRKPSQKQRGNINACRSPCWNSSASPTPSSIAHC